MLTFWYTSFQSIFSIVCFYKVLQYILFYSLFFSLTVMEAFSHVVKIIRNIRKHLDDLIGFNHMKNMT